MEFEATTAKIAGDMLERVRVNARKVLLDPTTVADIPVDVRLLLHQRSTVMFFDHASFARRDDDNWGRKGTARQPTKHLWRGYTMFTIGEPMAVPGSLTVPGVEACDEYAVDSMQEGHREFLSDDEFPFDVCVARLVTKEEIIIKKSNLLK